MNRLFSIRRRRPNIVDVYTPRVAGVDGYRLKWSQNFDGSFSEILTSPNVGFCDDNVDRRKLESQPNARTDVRIVFDPATYAIADDKAFWLKFVPVTAGVEGTASAAMLVLPDSAHHGVGLVAISGNAPNAASVAGSLQIDLPMLGQDFRFVNHDASKDLFIATEAGGAEFIVPKGATQVVSLGYMGTQSSLYVRGDSAVVNFTAMYTLAFPR